MSKAACKIILNDGFRAESAHLLRAIEIFERAARKAKPNDPIFDEMAAVDADLIPRLEAARAKYVAAALKLASREQGGAE